MTDYPNARSEEQKLAPGSDGGGGIYMVRTPRGDTRIIRSIEGRRIKIDGTGDLHWPDENGLDVRGLPRKCLDASDDLYDDIEGSGGAWSSETLLFQGSLDRVKWHDLGSLTTDGPLVDYSSFPYVRLKVASAAAIKVGANLRCEEA